MKIDRKMERQTSLTQLLILTTIQLGFAVFLVFVVVPDQDWRILLAVYFPSTTFLIWATVGNDALSAIPGKLIYGLGNRTNTYVRRHYKMDLRTAEGLLLEGDTRAALKMYKYISSKAPNEARPVWELALLYKKIGHEAQAKAQFSKLLNGHGKRLGESHDYVRTAMEYFPGWIAPEDSKLEVTGKALATATKAIESAQPAPVHSTATLINAGVITWIALPFITVVSLVIAVLLEIWSRGYLGDGFEIFFWLLLVLTIGTNRVALKVLG